MAGEGEERLIHIEKRGESERIINTPGLLRIMNALLNTFICPECIDKLVMTQYSLYCRQCAIYYRNIPGDAIEAD